MLPQLVYIIVHYVGLFLQCRLNDEITGNGSGNTYQNCRENIFGTKNYNAQCNANNFGCKLGQYGVQLPGTRFQALIQSEVTNVLCKKNECNYFKHILGFMAVNILANF